MCVVTHLNPQKCHLRLRALQEQLVQLVRQGEDRLPAIPAKSFPWRGERVPDIGVSPQQQRWTVHSSHNVLACPLSG